MPKPRLIGRSPQSRPTDLKGSRGHVHPLPDDLLRAASRRLGVMSLLVAILWLFGLMMDHLVALALHPENPAWSRLGMTDLVAGSSIAVSLALFFYTRRSDRNPRLILDLGLGYMVLMSLALGVITHWDPLPKDYPITSTISWIGAVVVMFAAIVPSARSKTLVAGLIAASMNPLGMFIAKARGVWDFGPPVNVLLMHYPDYMLVGAAVVISHVMTKLGQQVVRARELGSYQLGELLGSGGMGEVYKASHRMLARPAAIKLIRPEKLGAENGEPANIAIKRFRREAEVASTLRSPHTVELYDFGITEDETLYFVMELLDGMDLETLVRQKGPVSASRAIFILRQACESLEEAHVAGLVHRDIKPANIHVGRLGLQYDFVKVLDFGLVKSMAEAGTGPTLETAIGSIPGTPAYMAPEMARGENLDGRTDVYGLGCVAYFLLTGQLVFEAATGLQMILKHMWDEPVPPSGRTELPVPAALDKLVLACLAKEPRDRPQGAAALARSLDAIVLEPWSEEQAREWWRINRPA